MISIFYCLRRKPGLSPEEFAAYWCGPHADLVRSLAGRLGIARYVQNHGTLQALAAQMQALRGTADGFDGIAEISFASPDDLARGNTDPAAQDAQHLLAEDEAKFIDIARSVILFTSAQEVIA